MKNRINLIIISIFIFFNFTAIQAQPVKITATDGEAGDHFGSSVSISGDYAIAGADWENEKGTYAGSAYIFKRNGKSWAQQAKLTADVGEAMDFFGESVSISGDYAIIGAHGDDDRGNYAGAAYIFKRDGETWTQQQKLTAGDGAERDYFGMSVSISGDYAIVGAYSDDDSGSASGSAYIFKRDAEVWTQQAKLISGDCAASDWFGRAVSISGDYAIIGAFGDGDNEYDAAGAAYIFKRNGDNWTEQVKLIAGDRAYNDLFGRFVSISGEYAIVGAYWDDDKGTNSGSAYIYKCDGELWTLQAKITADDGAEDAYFGGSVSIFGEYAAIGTYVNEDDTTPSGSAYIFKRSGEVWSQYSKLTDEFGGPVSINGSYAIAGAWWGDDNGENSGLAHIYNVAGMAPNNPPVVAHKIADQVKQVDFATYTVADLDTVFSDPDGDVLNYTEISDNNIAVTINGSLLELGSTPGFAGICQVIVSASDSEYSISDTFTVTVEGNVLYVTPSSQSIQATSVRTSFYVYNTGPGEGTMNWTAVANDSWLTIVRGGSGTNSGLITVEHGSNSGAQRSGSITITATGAMNSPQTVNITQGSGLTEGETKIVADDGNEEDNFGGAVCISGEYIIVGAYCQDTFEDESGAAYIFKREGESWTQQAKLISDGSMLADRFGNSVSIDNDYAVVGAYRDSVSAKASGSAYIFKRNGGLWTQQVKLTASDGDTNDIFGCSVSISGDYAILGAEGDDDKGSDAGSTYIFKRDGESWIQQSKLLADDGAKYDDFGKSVCISGDYAIIGAEGVGQYGSAYIFKRDGENWIQQAKLIDADSVNGDHFGESVSICGYYAIVGASWGGENRSGSAYIFVRNGDLWTQQARLAAKDSAGWDYFGKSVYISGDYAIMGSSWDDDNGDYSGSAYIFKRDGGSWVQHQKVTAGDGAVRDFFGRSVSVWEDYAVVGSYLDDDNGDNSGSAYVYCIDSVGTGISSHKQMIPRSVVLYQNYPNPFNPETTIKYKLKSGHNGAVKITVYNIRGQIVKVLVNKVQKAGDYTIKFNAAGLSSGIYYYLIKIKDFKMVKKMVLLR